VFIHSFTYPYACWNILPSSRPLIYSFIHLFVCLSAQPFFCSLVTSFSLSLSRLSSSRAHFFIHPLHSVWDTVFITQTSPGQGACVINRMAVLFSQCVDCRDTVQTLNVLKICWTTAVRACLLVQDVSYLSLTLLVSSFTPRTSLILSGEHRCSISTQQTATVSLGITEALYDNDTLDRWKFVSFVLGWKAARIETLVIKYWKLFVTARVLIKWS